MIGEQPSLTLNPSSLVHFLDHCYPRHIPPRTRLTNQNQITHPFNRPVNKRHSQHRASAPAHPISHFGNKKDESCYEASTNANPHSPINRQLYTTQPNDHLSQIPFINNYIDNNMGSNVLKIACGTEIRRVPILTDKITYNELCLLAHRLFKTICPAMLIICC